jgi:hypothetical protein
VDISNTLERKMQALQAYQSEWERAAKNWAEYFTNQARNDGLVIGVHFAECFETIRWLVF